MPGTGQVFGSRRPSYVASVLLGNLGIATGYGWWTGKHNRHHAHPDTEGADPDIAVGALAFTVAQASSGRGVARLVFPCHGSLFFPLLLEAIRKVLLFVIPLAVAGLVASQPQEIVRYLKVRQMSSGTGHPENVPVRGSNAHPDPRWRRR